MSDKKSDRPENATPEDANTARDPTPSEDSNTARDPTPSEASKTAEQPTTSEESRTARDPTDTELQEARRVGSATRPVQEFSLTRQHGEEFDMTEIMASRIVQKNPVDPATAAAQKKMERKARRQNNR